LNFYNPNHTPNQRVSDGEIDLVKLAASLWRGKWIVLAFVLFCVCVADFYVRYVAVPLYPATAKIALKEHQPEKILTDIESLMSNGPITDSGINTELEVLRSRDLVGKLVDSLDLTNQPALNPLLREPRLSSQIRAQLFTLFGLASEKPKTPRSPEVVRSIVINSVLNTMAFSNTKNTRVINISVTTTEAALSGVGGERDILLIAGGQGKGADFSQLQEAVSRHCKLLILMGEDAPLLQKALSSCVAVLRVSSLDEAVNVAAMKAEAGDVVLLSPACASFDMFSGYVQRGEAFCTLVNALTGGVK
jgi:capsular polysaccharide biosynthesis protein